MNYQNDAAGRVLSRILSSGAKSVYTYDNGSWLNGQKHLDATGATIVDQGYTRDRTGNITAIALAGGGGTSIGASGSTTNYYAYYPATQTGTVEGYTPIYNDRLKEIRVGSMSGAIDSSFTYDNGGRMTTQTGSTPRSYSWDAKGRLTSEGTETYAYDPLNHRIRRTGGTLGALDYFLEGEHLESVYKGNKIQEKYFRGLSIDELVAGFTTQNGKLVPFFFQHDQVNSVVAVSKPNGGTQQKASYKAFGEDKAGTGTQVSRLKYTGREDDGSGLYQYRARYYDPKVGRFISEDPKKFEAGVNFYAYVENNPVNYNDPLGLELAAVFLPGHFNGCNCKPNEVQEFLVDRRIQQNTIDFVTQARNAGLNVSVNNTLRTLYDQEALRKNNPHGNPVAKGYSLHNAGFGVDLNGVKNLNVADKTALDAMAPRNGFSPIKNDPPHYQIRSDIYGKTLGQAVAENQWDLAIGAPTRYDSLNFSPVQPLNMSPISTRAFNSNPVYLSSSLNSSVQKTYYESSRN